MPYDAPMQISLWVPYDEQRLHRSVREALRPQVRRIRVAGVVLLALGVAAVALHAPLAASVALLTGGVMLTFVLGPLTARRVLRMQAPMCKDGFHMTLSDEWVAVAYPLFETRIRWAGLDRVVETSDAWHMRSGQLLMTTIPKDLMSDAQRAEFAAFLVAERERHAGRAFLGQPR